jgi:hypothetical protein
MRRRAGWISCVLGAGLALAAPHADGAAERPHKRIVMGKLLGSFDGPERSPDGLELTAYDLSTMDLPASTGQTLYTSFTLTNVTAAPIRLGPGGMALAARIVTGGREEPRRIGARHANATIEPGGYLFFTWVGLIDAAGKWQLSPTYDVVGGHCPARWHELSFDVAATPGWVSPQQEREELERLHARVYERRETLLAHCSDGGTLPHGLNVAIHVRGLSKPRVGDKLKAHVMYQNMRRDSPVLFGPKGVFVAARFTPKGTTTPQTRDFGHQYPYVVLRVYSPTMSITVEPQVTVDGAGTWELWPSFEIDGQEAPEHWCAVKVEVEE